MRDLSKPHNAEIGINCPCGVNRRYKVDKHIVTGECVCGRVVMITTPIKYLEGK